MADTAVTERRVRPIQDAIETGNWKQALKECDKWLKKGESSDRFLALRTTVLLNQADEKTKKKGVADLLALCRKEPPVLNVDAIRRLQESLTALDLGFDEGLKLWQRATAAKPNDKDLITTWLNASIVNADWISAQKATTALRKAFPKDGHYEFANILMCFMIHQDAAVPEKDRALFGTLANRMVTKAAQAGTTDKAISTTDELSLLATILKQTGTSQELITILKSSAMKRVIDQDKSSADHILIEAVIANGDRRLMLDTVIDLLESDDPGLPNEDDKIWALLEIAATDPKLHAECLDVISRQIAKTGSHRRALLSRIELLKPQTQDPGVVQGDFLDTCAEYYQEFGTKAFCFDDLAPRLQSCDDDTIGALLQRFEAATSNEANVVKLAHKLKLRYFQLFRKPASREDTIKLAVDALELHSKKESSNAYVPEAALLAILSLLQESFRGGSTINMHQANVLAHALRVKFKDYYPFSVMLLQMQRYGGQATLAMNTFLQLNIKNLQWETLGHLILERIAYLHPYQHGQGDNALNPLGGLDSALSVVAKSHYSMDRAIRDGLKLGSYVNVLDTIELRSKIQRSINCRLCMIEQRKIQRIRGLPITGKVPSTKHEPVDMRDTSFMPSYGTNENDLRQKLAAGPQCGNGWLLCMSMHDRLMSSLELQRGAAAENIADQELETLLGLLDRCDVAATDLTEHEKNASRIYKTMAQFVLHRSGKVSEAPKLALLIDELAQRKARKPPPRIGGVEFPDFDWLARQFLHVEVLGSIARFTGAIKQTTKPKKEKISDAGDVRLIVDELTMEVKTQSEAIREDCSRVSQGLKESGVLGQLVDAAISGGGEEDSLEGQDRLNAKLAGMLEQTVVEQYCSEIRESWEDALEGLARAAARLK